MTSSARTRDDSDEVKDLLLWARSESIVINAITVGGVTLHVQDLRVVAPGAPGVSKSELDEAGRNLYAQFGGKLLEEVEQHAEQSVIEDDD